MFSEEAKRELLEAGTSSALREELEKMAENVRRADKAMSLDDLLSFLTAADRIFSAPHQPPSHESYVRALI